jgi:hypothetical protein
MDHVHVLLTKPFRPVVRTILTDERATETYAMTSEEQDPKEEKPPESPAIRGEPRKLQTAVPVTKVIPMRTNPTLGKPNPG